MDMTDLYYEEHKKSAVNLFFGIWKLEKKNLIEICEEHLTQNVWIIYISIHQKKMRIMIY